MNKHFSEEKIPITNLSETKETISGCFQSLSDVKGRTKNEKTKKIFQFFFRHSFLAFF